MDADRDVDKEQMSHFGDGTECCGAPHIQTGEPPTSPSNVPPCATCSGSGYDPRFGADPWNRPRCPTCQAVPKPCPHALPEKCRVCTPTSPSIQERLAAIPKSRWPFRATPYGEAVYDEKPREEWSWAVLSGDDPDDASHFYDAENEAKANELETILNAAPALLAHIDSLEEALHVVLTMIPPTVVDRTLSVYDPMADAYDRARALLSPQGTERHSEFCRSVGEPMRCYCGPQADETVLGPSKCGCACPTHDDALDNCPCLAHSVWAAPQGTDEAGR